MADTCAVWVVVGRDVTGRTVDVARFYAQDEAQKCPEVVRVGFTRCRVELRQERMCDQPISAWHAIGYRQPMPTPMPVPEKTDPHARVPHQALRPRARP